MVRLDNLSNWIYHLLVIHAFFHVGSSLAMGNSQSGQIVCQAPLQIRYEDRCCDSCQPGYYMVKPCSNEDPSSRICERCEPNTYMDQPNLLSRCFPLVKCNSRQETVRIGTATNNFKCSCKPDYEETADGSCVRKQKPKPDRPGTIAPRKKTTPLTQTQRSVTLTRIYPESTITDSLATSKNKDTTKINVVEEVSEIAKDDDSSSIFRGQNSSAMTGDHIVIIIIVVIGLFCLTLIVIVIVNKAKLIAVLTRWVTQPDNPSIGSFGEDRNQSPEERLNGCGASASSLESGPTDDFRNSSTGSTTALGIKESVKSTSKTNLNSYGQLDASGVPETGKAKSCTSLNDLGNQLPGHGSDYAHISNKTPLLWNDAR